MPVTKIHLSYGRTFNLDNYESLRLDCGLSYELDEDEARGEGELDFGELWEVLKTSVKAQAMPVLAVRDRERARLAGQVRAAYGERED